MVAMSNPNAPVIKPFRSEPSEITATAISPVIASAVYSGGAKLPAICARKGALNIKTTPPNRPPNAEAEIAIPIASDAFPFCAIG